MFKVPWSDYAPALWQGLLLTLVYTVDRLRRSGGARACSLP